MSKELTEESIRKLQILAVDLNMIQSLARILNEIIKEDDNLKYYDVENLSCILKQKIIEASKDINLLHSILGI